MKTFLLRPSLILEFKRSLSFIGLFSLVLTIPLTTLAIVAQNNYTYKQQAAIGDNLVVNPSFEDTATRILTTERIYGTSWERSSPNSWVDWFAWIEPDTNAPNGNNVLQIASFANFSGEILYDQVVNLRTGEYTFSAFSLVTVLAGRGAQVVVACAENDGCGSYALNQNLVVLDFSQIGSWERKSAPVDIVNGGAYFVRILANDGTEALFDDISLSFNGNPGDPCISHQSEAACELFPECAWYICKDVCLTRGTPVDSVCNNNVVVNGSFEDTSTRTLSGERIYGATWERGSADHWGDFFSWITTTSDAQDGNNLLHLASSSETVNALLVYDQVVALEADTNYSYSAAAKLFTLVGRGAQAVIACAEPTGCDSYAENANITTLNFDNIGDWEIKNTQFTVPISGNYFVRVTANDGTEAFFDNILVFQESEVSESVTISGRTYCVNRDSGVQQAVVGTPITLFQEGLPQSVISTSSNDGYWSATKTVEEWTTPVASIRPNGGDLYPDASFPDAYTGRNNGITCTDSNFEGLSFNESLTLINETVDCRRNDVPIDQVNFNLGYCVSDYGEETYPQCLVNQASLLSGVGKEAVSIISDSYETWLNSCLGCSEEGEQCLMVVTPGRKLTLQVSSPSSVENLCTRYEYHTAGGENGSCTDYRLCNRSEVACSETEEVIYFNVSMQGKEEGNWDGNFYYWIAAVENPSTFLAEMVPGIFNGAGEAVIDVSEYNLTSGESYNFSVKAYQHLLKTVEQVYAPNTTVDFGDILTGDVYLPEESGQQDGEINSADFSKVVSLLWQVAKDYYDLDGNGEINSIDLSLIISNWFRRDQ